MKTPLEPLDSTRLPRDRNGRLEAYAWPGGYPICYLDEETGDTLCARCADDEPGPVSWFIHYEGAPEWCAVCGAEVDSAYGDPEEVSDE